MPQHSQIDPIIIGTRGSPLALAQAHAVQKALCDAHEELTTDIVQIRVIKTSGDRILDRHLMLAGGKGLFTKEIEEALLAGEIHCAVHSCKDMPTQLPEGLELAAFLKREDPRDVLISRDGGRFADLPEGAVVGTASLRRRAQALRQRPDLKIVNFRGNVQTRLKKLQDGAAEATFLARAGLNRMDMSHVASETLDSDRFLPAPAQGIVTVECRTGDKRMADYLRPLHSEESAIIATAERAFLAALDGSCRTPIAALAEVNGADVHLTAELLSVDGQTHFRKKSHAPIEDAAILGDDSGKLLRSEAGDAFFEALHAAAERVASEE